MTIPFDKENFARQIKPLVSGVNLSLEYDNVASSLDYAGSIMTDYLTADVYEGIANKNLSDNETLNTTLFDFLRRSLIHFAIEHAVTYLSVNISNDGITTYKGDNETSAYKYQTDALKNQLINDAWHNFSRLVGLLNASDIEAWQTATHKSGIADLSITFNDFARYVGVTEPAFIYFAAAIIREVTRECVESRNVSIDNEDVKRAVCWEVMSRATRRLPYNVLPESVRLDINNEQTKSNQQDPQGNVKMRLADSFETKANDYWKVIDSRAVGHNVSQPRYNPSDKHVLL